MKGCLGGTHPQGPAMMQAGRLNTLATLHTCTTVWCTPLLHTGATWRNDTVVVPFAQRGPFPFPVVYSLHTEDIVNSLSSLGQTTWLAVLGAAAGLFQPITATRALCSGLTSMTNHPPVPSWRPMDWEPCCCCASHLPTLAVKHVCAPAPCCRPLTTAATTTGAAAAATAAAPCPDTHPSCL